MSRTRSAFTLIELIVVISIVGTLCVFVYTSLKTARVNALELQCSGNMRQIGMGLNAYCNEHQGEYPQSMHTTEEEEKAWVWLLKPYLDNVDEIRICPADPKAKERLEAKGTSYILNEYICVPLTDGFGRIKESFTNRQQLKRPDQTIVMFTGADDMDVGLTGDHTHSRNWKNWKKVLRDIQPDRHRSGSANKDHTSGSANYLYADGHVESIEAKEVKRRIERKEPFAKPPE